MKPFEDDLLFNNGKPWIESDSDNLFDVTMGMQLYEGAEVCEVVGLGILNHLGKKFGNENISTFGRENEKRTPSMFREV